ncbi:MAG TPA: adenylate/guanylate cyclase domain-containing protein, partial [Anaerolineae bacterium]|nr:adenylate/guanylate cyclase domain-containing protein [Anaerolineae bacterium]
MRSDLPSGTVTFLFTDVEGSTQQVQRLGDSYASILATQRKILRAAFQKFHGHEVDTQGDSFFVAFARADDAVAASVKAQRALAEHAWPAGESARVRMGLHTGAPQLTVEGYVGLDVNIAARLCAAAHGGQVLLSQATRDLVEQRLPEDVSLRDLGEHRLKDLDQPRRIFQLVIAELPDAFPPLRSLDALPHNLPIQLTSFVGRTRELAEVKRLLGSTRLLTLTGAGGAGKTRLALQIGADLAESYPNGVWFVELAPLADSTLVSQAVATTLGVREQSGQSLLASLEAHLRSKNLLLILDNCEHLIDACARLADSFLRACPNLSILATSREALGIGGETTWVVPSLSLPEEREQRLTFSELSQYEAVQLFVDRAVAVQPSFKLTEL